MALQSSQKEVAVVGVKASSVALFEGTLAGAIGLVVALLYALRVSVHLTAETNSVLAGLTFGLGAGIVSVIVLPLVYFALGWFIGYVHAWVFNAIVSETSGIVFYTKK